ncbi:MAG: PTS sugar transporter subunit IIC [Brevinema sp.]
MLNTILMHVTKFATLKPVLAMKDGLLYTVPASLVGACFLLFANVPINGYQEWMTSILGVGWDKPLYQVVNSTLHIGALLGVFGISCKYAENEGYNGTSAGIVGIIAFIILNNHFTDYNGDIVTGVISSRFLGGPGIIGAILTGLFVGFVYSWCLKKNIKITLPDAVPAGVSNAFTSILPCFIVVALITIVYIIFDKFLQTSVLEWIYHLLQSPLQGLTSTLTGAITITVLISLLWWCGIHGPLVVMGVMGPILGANGLANQKLRDEGIQLIADENAYIVTGQLIDQYVTVTGSGFTLGLVLAMLFFARSAQYKELGKMAIIPSIFNINEPIVFGTPIVFNLVMLVPFVLAPTLSCLLVYTAIKIGFLPPFGAIAVPWTTPIIFSGFLVGGWKAALLQLISAIMTTLIYIPFFKIQDTITYKQETEEK